MISPALQRKKNDHAALSTGVGSAHGRTAKLLGMDKMGGGPGFMPRAFPFMGLANGAA